MKATTERELKLAGDDVRLADLRGEPIADRTFISTYHDTPDLRLAASGITLRHRVEGSTGAWQLKLPQDGSRLEVEVGGNSNTVPKRILGLLHAHLRSVQLQPVAALRTERSGVRVRDGGAGLVEVVRDSVLVLEGGAGTRSFEELELELVAGPASALGTSSAGCEAPARPMATPGPRCSVRSASASRTAGCRRSTRPPTGWPR